MAIVPQAEPVENDTTAEIRKVMAGIVQAAILPVASWAR